MPSEQIIHFPADGIQLTGTLHLPDTPQPPVVIGCHGLLADRRSPKQIALARALNRIGLAYLRFDHRGCGDSQGQFDTAHLLSSRCSDLYHAIQAMQSRDDLGPLAGLFGSSFGGTVVLATAARGDAPRLITYAAPVRSDALRRPNAAQIAAKTPVSDPSRNDYAFDIGDCLPAVGHILVMHGEDDEIVPLAHAREIHQNAREPKQLIIHVGGDHRMSDPRHQDDFIRSALAWFAPQRS